MEETKHMENKPMDKVDWPVMEAILYGMTKALDYLGEQAQILVNKMGEEMLNFLLEKGYVQRSDDPMVLMDAVTKFFMEHGFANKIEMRMEGMPPKYAVAEYSNWGYYDVFKALQDKQCFLFSCPACLITSNLGKKAFGFGFKVAEMEDKGGKTMVIKFKIIPRQETFSEETSKEISEKM